MPSVICVSCRKCMREALSLCQSIFTKHIRDCSRSSTARLMPSLGSIDGMGDKAAEAMMEAAKDGPFLSRDDLRSRSKAPQNVIDKMGELGLLGSLPQSNQLSLFDFM